ncbi:hypothetical protein [Candidatus Rhabdochlamydia porcellionis]|jgi:hypothetical protein|uniref:Uncharacterized protein n=1 Tax=Candidatus Rhabdochlamydia porcellionis TaxID=225148 RepID=A0ABX8Z394_9BACT|nr:hypothetical protein [Candidatus Rhabdochlamydia porcellionis]QZA59012.1 hypothetical protein RHAB15C_0000896 [Candidatus Rhabdochlamydia porcellionis]
MSYPIPREGSNIEEVILSIARMCFLAYCIDKVRQIFYRVVRIFPYPIAQSLAISLAPTGVYSVVALDGSRSMGFRN